MAHNRTFFRRVYPNVGGSISSLLSGAAIMLLLYRQPVVAEDTSSATDIPIYKCDHCGGESNCTLVTDCKIACGELECDDSYFRFKRTFEHCGNSPARKRRQITQSAVMTTATTTIPSTTIGLNAWICKNCSVAGCKKCIDMKETPSCQTCHDGYLLNNENHDCYRPIEPEKGMSGEAIAGIVIAIMCIIGIGVVIALYVLQKFRGSGDVNGRAERMKPISSAGSKVSSNVFQITKVNTKELQRKHDQITRYKKDPTSKDPPKNKRKCCRTSSHENTILAEMGEAPPPPVEQNTYTPMSNRYDALEKNQKDSELYLPVQPGEEELYLNTAAIANELNRTEGHYENTQQKNHNGVSANSTKGNTSKHPAMTKSQDSIDAYEPLGPALPAHESQEIYANDDATVLVQTGAADTGDIHLNEDTDDVYQNA